MDIEKIIQQLTLEEKADFCSGSDFWHTQPVERLGVPAVMMSDGPSGLRKQNEQGDHLGINESIPAVCFAMPENQNHLSRTPTSPTASTTTAVWAQMANPGSCISRRRWMLPSGSRRKRRTSTVIWRSVITSRWMP